MPTETTKPIPTEIEVCGSCYNLIIEYCTDELRFEVGTAFAGQTLAWQITDKFGNIYRGASLVNAQGFIEIETELFPDGYFTPHSGNFRIEFFAPDASGEPDTCDPLIITICSAFYTCIIFSFASINTIESEDGGYGYDGKG